MMTDGFAEDHNRKVSAIMPASCGELVQGVINGINFHITLPVNKFCRATACFKDESSCLMPKTQTAIGLFEQFIKAEKGKDIAIEPGYFIDLTSEIPIAKGMAGSTADIMAAIYAASGLFGEEILPKEAACIALAVEPTDGTFIKGIAVFDHIKGKIMEEISVAPELDVLAVIGHETLPTDSITRPDYSPGQLKKLKRAYREAVRGLELNDFEMIGNAANISSGINQKFLHKQKYDLLRQLAPKLGAFGVTVAHSGTVMGLLCAKGDGSRIMNELLDIDFFGHGEFKLELLNTVNGGCRSFSEELSVNLSNMEKIAGRL